MGTKLQRIADNEAGCDIRPGEFYYQVDPSGLRKWMYFWVPGQAVPFCIALRPQRNGQGATWAVSGDPDAPDILPSINVKDTWHGWIRAGVASPAI